jgi:tetratricopeptide (TPR) repeat protein
MKTLIKILFAPVLLLSAGMARADALADDLGALQHGWAHAYYELSGAQQSRQFETLAQHAGQLTLRYGGRAEPLVWEAIVLSSEAKFKGGLGALSLVKRARELLLAAEHIDPQALDGSVYASLGSLYAKVPGWPIGFGDKDKARTYLQKALSINPQGIDPNYFYAELLLDDGDRAGAAAFLNKALAAPPRPGREDADAGRRAEAQQLLASLQRS